LRQREEPQPRLRIADAPLLQLLVGHVLLGVGIKEDLEGSVLVAGLGKGLARVLIQAPSLLGRLQGDVVATRWVNDASRGHLHLHELHGLFVRDQALLHGLEEGDLLARERVFVARHGPLRVLQLLVDVRADDSLPDSLVHTELLVVHGVDDEARGSLGLQQGQGYPWHHNVLLHGLVNAHPLVRRLEHDPPDAARAVEVLPDRVHVQDLLRRDGSLQHLLEQGPVDDARFHQVVSTDAASQGRELDGGPLLHFLL
ncbi:hypothetical protein N305_07667, partial [Manacus vitellinus]